MKEAVAVVDTSVLLNLLRVPGRDQHADEVANELDSKRREGHELLLPFASIVETGNHIGRLEDGGRRRQCATALMRLVHAACDGEAPFTAISPVEVRHIKTWLEEFPNWAGRPQSTLGDLSIKCTWDEACKLNGGRRVYIWSYDSQLTAYDRLPTISR